MKTEIKDVYGQFDGRISVGPLGMFKHALFCKVPEHGQTIITDVESLKALRDDLSIYLNDVRPGYDSEHHRNCINELMDKHAKELFNLNFKLETMTADRDAEKDMKAKARDQRDFQTKRVKELEQNLDDLISLKRQWRNLAHKHEQTILDLKYRIVELENPIEKIE